MNQHQLMGPLIQKAKASGVKKVVMMTAMGANAYEAAPLRQAELALERSGVPYNIIRPNWFMQNFNTFWIDGILDANKILLPVGQARASFIDARDISAVASALLQSDGFTNRAFDLTGAEALTHDEVAAVLSGVTGKSIAFEDITPEATLERLKKIGVPQDYAEFLNVILGALKQGHAERITDSVEVITGRRPISFSQYAHDYRSAWI